MTIFERVKNLHLPLEEYVVIGAGILEALGIRNTRDVDVIVMPKLFKKLRESKAYKEEIRWGKLFLFADNIDIGSKLDWENYLTTIEGAIKTATIIDGIPFLNLQETIKFKQAMGREKDFKDIKLIEEYLKNYATEFLGKVVKIKIDRPLGSKHPKHDMIYEVNYGFVPDTKAPDGEEIDAYLLGVDKPVDEFTGTCIAVIRRLDDNDDKLVIIPENSKNISDEEVLGLTSFQEKWFKSEIIR